MANSKRTIPPSVVKRLPKYYACVQSLSMQGVDWVSSLELADHLGLTSSTVRQDFSYFDYSGVSKRGYEISGLQNMLSKILGTDMEWKVVVVGAGNLGHALALHEDFARRGFHIVGVFDSDDKKCGKSIGSLSVRPMEELGDFVKSEGVAMGIIAVPAHAAQSVADLLVDTGVSGLLNMALTHVVAPTGVAVIESRIVASLLELSYAVSLAKPSR